MLIDWFTVVAQIVNFVVLVALLKHFLFGRLVDAIDAREQRIATRIAEAEQKNRDAEERVAGAQAETDRIRQEHDRIIAAARDDAEHDHKEMLQKARASVQALEAKWNEDLEREKSAFFEEIRSRAATEILAITRRALADLASADLDRSALESFLKKLQSIDFANLHGDLIVRTSRDLGEEAQHRIEDALERRLGEAAHIQFERAPQMSWGLELRMNGKRIGWNPESYIGSLEENLRHALEHRRP